MGLQIEARHVTTPQGPVYLVTCADGRRRHPAPFRTLEAAEKFAHWACGCRGHHHTIDGASPQPAIPGLERF